MGFLCAIQTTALVTMLVGYQGPGTQVDLVDSSVCLDNQRSVEAQGFAVDAKPIEASGVFEVYVSYKCVRPKPGNLCPEHPLDKDGAALMALDDKLAKTHVATVHRWAMWKFATIRGQAKAGKQ